MYDAVVVVKMMLQGQKRATPFAECQGFLNCSEDVR